MGYEKEDEYLTDMISYYIIELTKFKENKPRTGGFIRKMVIGNRGAMKK